MFVERTYRCAVQDQQGRPAYWRYIHAFSDPVAFERAELFRRCHHGISYELTRGGIQVLPSR